jgi:nitroreductase
MIGDYIDSDLLPAQPGRTDCRIAPRYAATMDTWTAISTKRAIRKFADRPLDEDHLTRILDAGRHAHSSKNTQRWTFVVVRDRDRLKQLSKVGPWAGHLAQAAVGIALITPTRDDGDDPPSVMFDLGQAASQMMLAAWDLGVGTCPVTAYEPDLAAQILGLPDGQRCRYLISVGYPARPQDLTRQPKAGGRKELDEVVRYEAW